jgi:hypothetical protein
MMTYFRMQPPSHGTGPLPPGHLAMPLPEGNVALHDTAILNDTGTYKAPWIS